MKSVGYTAWKEAISRNPKNPLFTLSSYLYCVCICFFSSSLISNIYFGTDFPNVPPILDCKNTAEALKNAPFVCPTGIYALFFYLSYLFTDCYRYTFVD